MFFSPTCKEPANTNVSGTQISSLLSPASGKNKMASARNSENSASNTSYEPVIPTPSSEPSFYRRMLRKSRIQSTKHHEDRTLEDRLRAASKEGKVSEVRRMLARGAKIEGDQDGCTPIHHTSRILWNIQSSVDIVRLLCEHGGSVNCRDRLAQTPLHKLVSNSLKRGLFDLETNCSSVRMIKTLVELGAHVNAVDSAGQSALHVASSCRNFKSYSAIEELQLLIELGCDLNYQDKQGESRNSLIVFRTPPKPTLLLLYSFNNSIPLVHRPLWSICYLLMLTNLSACGTCTIQIQRSTDPLI